MIRFAASAVIVCWLLLIASCVGVDPLGSAEDPGSVVVENASALMPRLPAERVAVGVPHDYKPCLLKMPDGELLLIAFHAPRGKSVGAEYCFLYRSSDGGRTWSEREELDFEGREPYFSMTKSGVIFVSVHVLPAARGNTEGYTYSYLYRSEDGARTWDWTKVPYDETLRASRRDGQHPEKDGVGTSRNVIELQDGTLFFGVSSSHGAVMSWRSTDDGRTWEKRPAGKFGGPDIATYHGSVHNEAFLYQAASGDLLSIKRVALEHYPPVESTERPASPTDQYHRMVLYRSKDGGDNWTMEEIGSYYGEMYPSVTQLNDDRMLFTFTQRTAVPPNKPPLGVRAVLGEAIHDGFKFHFDRDRIVLSAKTPPHLTSGGGFGPTVQLDDDTLVTSYSYRDVENVTHIEVVRWRLVGPGR